MKAPDLTSWLIVKDIRAIDLLAKPEYRFLLLPFFQAEKSVSEAAEEARVELRKMYYLCQRACKLGLLRIASTQKRKGRAIKRYRAAADAFFVPYTYMRETLREIFFESELKLLPMVADASAHSFVKINGDVLYDDEWGRLYRPHLGTGFSSFTNSSKKRFLDLDAYLEHLNDAPTPYLKYTLNLSLSQADAKSLQRELIDVMQRYTRRVGDGPLHHLKLYLGELPKDYLS